LTASAPLSIAQNLIPDPTFSFGVSTWAAREGHAQLDWIPAPGVDGAIGFARLTALALPPLAYFARICLPVQPDTIYSWGGSQRLLATMTGSSDFVLVFYGDSSCASPLGLLSSQSSILDGLVATPGTWYRLAGPDIRAPSTAASVALEARLVVVGASTLRSLDFDNVYFGPQGASPPAAASIPTLSTSSLLFFAGVLGALGLWRLVGSISR
jgi:hypothetical protein